ncbi:MAG: TolC family protein [Leptospiraceae bacterium]|nr:TolC family protein [Leptospiraceae bacterium]
MKKNIKFGFILFYTIIYGINSEILSDELKKLENLVSSHPETKSLSIQVLSKISDSNHSDVYPDPKIGIVYKNYPYNRELKRTPTDPNTPGMTGIEYSISQPIPFPGKKTNERKIKLAEVNEVKEESALKTSSFIEKFLNLKLNADIQEKRMIYLKEMSELYKSLGRVSGASYITGKTDFDTSNMYHLDSLMISEKAKEAEYTLAGINSDLAYYLPYLDSKEKMNLEQLFVELETDLEQVNRISPDFGEHPLVKLSNSIREKRIREKTRGDQDHYPDFEVFASYLKRKNIQYMFDGGYLGNYSIMDSTEYRGDLFSMGATMKIPVWSLSKNSDLQDQNRKKIQEAELFLEKTELLLQTEWKKNISLYYGIKERHSMLSGEHITILEKSLNSIKANYQAGKGNYEKIAKIKSEYLKAKIEMEELRGRQYSILITLGSLMGKYSQLFTDQLFNPNGENNANVSN